MLFICINIYSIHISVSRRPCQPIQVARLRYTRETSFSRTVLGWQYSLPMWCWWWSVFSLPIRTRSVNECSYRSYQTWDWISKPNTWRWITCGLSPDSGIIRNFSFCSDISYYLWNWHSMSIRMRMWQWISGKQLLQYDTEHGRWYRNELRKRSSHEPDWQPSWSLRNSLMICEWFLSRIISLKYLNQPVHLDTLS